jgi:hypothetical protein
MSNYSEQEIQLILDLHEQGKSWQEISNIYSAQFPGNPKSPNAVRKAFRRNRHKTVALPHYKAEDKKVYKKILVVSDMHIPYQHVDTVDFLKALNKKYKFDKVVCIGDEVDYHAISFHDSDPDLPSASDELELSRKQLRSLYKEFPEMDIVESNHGSLVYRKALASGLPKAFFKTYNDILNAPKGWKWQFDLKLNTPLGKVYFCHGKSGSPGKLASLYACSCVQGHFHQTSQVMYIGTPDKLMFDMHVGCLVNDHSLALGYNKLIPKRPIISVGIIINGIPQIIPMVLNNKGRWIGSL